MKFKYNHNINNFSGALGFTDEDLKEIKLLIIFQSLRTKVGAVQLFDNPDEEAPKEMTTLSGCLEMCLNICEERLQPLLLLYFKEIYDSCYEILNNYFESKNDEDKSIGASIKRLVTQVKMLPLIPMMEAIKKANGDFQKFKKLIIKDEQDSILKSLMGDDD